MNRLSPNFTLEELTATGTGIENEPLSIERDKLLYLAQYILQPIRDKWGRIQVTSGFRSAPVNFKVGGSPSSQHLFGEAADIVPLDAAMESVFEWIAGNPERFTSPHLIFGQAIWEPGWIHISLPRLNKPNQQALTFDGKEFRPYAR